MKKVMVLVLLLAAASVWAESAQVQIRQASVYDHPSVMAKFLGRLTLGDKVSVLSRKNGWVEVVSDEAHLKGWTREQGLTSAKVALRSGKNAQGASTTEVSLAGRGFSDPVESEYRQENPQLNYAVLDAMEKNTISDDELNAFLRDGGIHPEGDTQ